MSIKEKLTKLRYIISESDNTYLNYHAPRYEELVKILDSNYTEGKRILDIGNSNFSEIMSEIFHCKIDEIGFGDDSERTFGKQFKFNLNNSHDKSLWRSDFGSYDIIVFAEVIEHLYVSPNYVLNYLYSLLNKNGIIIIQTPNAVALHKRIKLLVGKNPYMLIREQLNTPGHFREYTKKELINYSTNNNLKIEEIYFGNYFDYKYSQDKVSNITIKKSYKSIINIFYSICLPSLKPGITLICKKY